MLRSGFGTANNALVHRQPGSELQHRQRSMGFEPGDAAVYDGVGIGVIGIDTEGLRQPHSVEQLDRGEAEFLLLHIAGGDEADPARAEDADAVIEDHVIVRPMGHSVEVIGCTMKITGTQNSPATA